MNDMNKIYWTAINNAWTNGHETPEIEALREEANIAAAESGADREIGYDAEAYEEQFINNAIQKGLST